MDKVEALDRRVSDNQRVQTHTNTVAANLATSANRLAKSLDVSIDKQMRDLAASVRDDEARDRNYRQAASETNRQTQAAFQPVFEPYGELPPAPVADENPSAYQCRLTRLTRDKLSVKDGRSIGDSAGTTVGAVAEIRGIDRSMPDGVLSAITEMVLKAAQVQARAPHRSTLPPRGEHVPRYVTDPMSGQKSIEYSGRESFIKGLSAPGRRVLRLIDPTKRKIL
jgi:hypothetical protein